MALVVIWAVILSRALPFYNNGSPIELDENKEEYKNLKTQCYFMFADKVERNKARTCVYHLVSIMI